jgi:hypothetical protein
VPALLPKRFRLTLEQFAALNDQFTPLNSLPRGSAKSVLALHAMGYLEEGRDGRYNMARAFRISAAGRQYLAQLGLTLGKVKGTLADMLGLRQNLVLRCHACARDTPLDVPAMIKRYWAHCPVVHALKQWKWTACGERGQSELVPLDLQHG